MRCDELIEHTEVEGSTLIIDVGVNTEFRKVVMTFMIVIVVMMVMLVLVMIVVIVIIIVIVVVMMVRCVFDFLNPSRRCRRAVKVKEMRVEDLFEVHITVVRFNDLGCRLYSANNRLDSSKFVFANFGCLI